MNPGLCLEGPFERIQGLVYRGLCIVSFDRTNIRQTGAGVAAAETGQVQ